MKAKKILFLLSGILKVVASSIAILFSLIVFLCRNLLRELLLTSFTVIEEIIEGMAEEDKYSELLSYSKTELVDYLVSLVVIIFVIVLIVAIIWMIFGIINIRLGSNNRFLNLTKGKAIALVVCSWILGFELFTNTMTTVAVCLRKKKDIDKLYTQANANETIEVK